MSDKAFSFDNMFTIYKSLVSALKHRDINTHLHSQRVIGLSEEIGKACKLTETEIGILKSGACFHDIGKIGIPDEILLKPGKLSQEEYKLMKRHAEKGEDIINGMNMKYSKKIASAVRHHHEFYNGFGYPDQISGEEISIFSRIISVADCYDALTEFRAYKKTRTHETAMKILGDEKGLKFDPYLVNKFETIIGNSIHRGKSPQPG